MNLQNNTILITGGGSGIGKGLAEMFVKKGNKVIIAGRSKEKLDIVTKDNKNIDSLVLDITSKDSIKKSVAILKEKYPELNVIIHNAGIMKPEKIGENDLDVSEDILMTNFFGQIYLNSMLLPQLKNQKNGVIMTVSSGLAFLPLAIYPTYCATKAAIHSYTQSLRTQLKDTSLKVIELIPPYVQTELQGKQQANDPNAMPIKDFIAEVTHILETQPNIEEIIVERVKFQRTAEASGEYMQRYNMRNNIT